MTKTWTLIQLVCKALYGWELPDLPVESDDMEVPTGKEWMDFLRCLYWYSRPRFLHRNDPKIPGPISEAE